MTEEFRKKNLLPSDEVYDTMVAVLKSQSRENVENASPMDKSRWRKRFQLSVVEGQEIITAREGQQLRLLKQSDLNSEIKRVHEKDLHSGICATFNKLKVTKIKYEKNSCLELSMKFER